MTRAGVLYLSPTAQLGGAELSLLDLVRHLDRARFAARIVCLGDGPLVGAAEAQGIPVDVLPMPRAFERTSLRGARTRPAGMARGVAAILPIAWRVRRLARAHRARIVHSNGNKAHLLSLAAALGTRVSLVWHVRDLLVPGAFERGLARLANRRVDAVVTNSEAVAERACALGVRPSLVHPVLNGVDCARFSPDGATADIRAEFGWKPECRVVGIVGMLAVWKGQEVFLQAARRVAQSRDDVRFVVVGDEIYATDGHGGFRARLEQQARELGLGTWVGFTGYRQDVPALLRDLDVVVHASVEPEPFGRVIAEAMACGRPVVATDGGGVREITGLDGEAARLVPRGDADALAGAIVSLLDDRERAATLGASARARIRARLDLPGQVREIERLYGRLLDRTRLRVLRFGKFYPPARGGMEVVLESLCTSAAERWRVTALVASDGPGTRRERRDGVEVVRAATVATAASVPLCPTMPWHLWRRRYDCVILHEPNPAAAVALWLYTPAPRLVIWHHSDIVRPRWAPRVYGPIQRALYRRAACVVTASPDLAADSPVVRHARRVEVLPYGIELARFGDAGERQRARTRAAGHAGPITLFVGRLVYYKGLEVLLDAMARCAGTLVVVGDGPLAAPLRARARELGIDGRTVFTGAVSDADLVTHFLAADLFVLPSTQRTEAFGIAQVEAMASGLPVVSTDLPTGVRWVNQHGVTGLVVPPGDVAALAGAIERLARDEPLRRAMGEAGRRRAVQEFSRERMVERFVALVEDVAAGDG